MQISTKLKDVKADRILRLVNEGSDTGTAVFITKVTRFQDAVFVTGRKLGKDGNPHPSGKLHSYTVVPNVANAAPTFQVSWNPTADTAGTPAVETNAESTEAPAI